MARGKRGKFVRHSGVGLHVSEARAALHLSDMVTAGYHLGRIAKRRPRSPGHFRRSAGRLWPQLALMLASANRTL